VKLESGWVGAGGNKLSRTQVIVNSDWAQAMMAHVWSGIIFEREPYRLGIAPVSGLLDLRVHLSHGGHGLNAQRWRGAHDAMSFPDMDHEPGDEVPDVIPLFHMCTAVEDVRAPKLFGHLGN
jgi:hypothetical protein